MAGQHKAGIARTQTALFPPTLEDYVAADSVVRVIDLYVSGLDLRALGFQKVVAAETGRPGYAGDDLFKLYLYGYWRRITSSRLLQAECGRNVEVMWLMRMACPSYRTICQFRAVNATAFTTAGAAFVQFMREMQLVGGAQPTVAVDGSKFKACAAKASFLDSEKLAKEQQKTQEQIEQYLRELDQTDDQEGAEEPAQGQRVQAALAALRERQAQLERAAAELAQQAAQPDSEAKPRVSLTDADAVLLTGKGSVVPGYNVMHAVDSQHKLIVAHEVTTERNDHASFEPMATAAKAALKVDTLTALGDSGFANAKQAQGCEDQGITPVVPMPRAGYTKGKDGKCFAKSRFTYDPLSNTYRCPANQVLTRFKRSTTAQTDYYTTNACESCALRPQCTSAQAGGRTIARSWYADAAERADARARSQRELMTLRSATVEHTFGNLKAMLGGGFALRGLVKVKGEMALAVLTYNLKRVLAVLGTAQLTQALRMRRVLNNA